MPPDVGGERTVRCERRAERGFGLTQLLSFVEIRRSLDGIETSSNPGEMVDHQIFQLLEISTKLRDELGSGLGVPTVIMPDKLGSMVINLHLPPLIGTKSPLRSLHSCLTKAVVSNGPGSQLIDHELD